MLRKRFHYVPEWNTVFERYSRKYLRRWLWQFSPTMDMDDLMQEAYFVFLKCEAHYFGKVTNVRWFMALYKQALHRRMITLAQRHNKIGDYNEQRDVPMDFVPLNSLTEHGDYGYLIKLIEEAPREARQVLEIILQKELPRDFVNSKVVTNKELCALLGISPTGRNLVALIRSHLE